MLQSHNVNTFAATSEEEPVLYIIQALTSKKLELLKVKPFHSYKTIKWSNWNGLAGHGEIVYYRETINNMISNKLVNHSQVVNVSSSAL